MDKKILLKRMRQSIFFMTGFSSVILILLSLLLPIFIDWDPIATNLGNRLLEPQWFSYGLGGHILGTDQLGRDVLVRLLLGGRYSLLIALVVIILQNVIGVVLGILAGYYGKIVDAIVMRACDVFLAIPNLILAIAVMAILGTSTFNLIMVLSFSGWVQVCKVIRNDVRVIKRQEFVHASAALGAGRMHIMFRQIFPNVTTNMLIIGSQRFGMIILLESTLSFLNLGVQPPLPSWGNMISAGRAFLATHPWLVLAPGFALMLTVLAFNFLGDGMRDVLDQKRKV